MLLKAPPAPAFSQAPLSEVHTYSQLRTADLDNLSGRTAVRHAKLIADVPQDDDYPQPSILGVTVLLLP